jgi:cystathionine beta-lyase
MPKKLTDQTKLIHTSSDVEVNAKTVGPPIQRGSTVVLPDAASLYAKDIITYGRGGLQPQQALCEALSELENASLTRIFPSGLAAMTATSMALLNSGDHILVADCVYAPTRRLFDRVLKRFGVTVSYFDPALPPDEVLAQAIKATRMIVLESPGSLAFEMQDTPRIAGLARERGILTFIDNTWAAGLYFKPLDHGIDISAQALTKYVGGHSDCFMGSVSVQDDTLATALENIVWHMGWSVSPDDAYTMLRGLRTLSTRMAQHGQSALDLATWLQTVAEDVEVICPGLSGSSGHELWSRDFTGQNGLLGLVLKGASDSSVAAFLDKLELFKLGFSWGGFESLAVNADPQFAVRKFPPKLSGPLVRLHVGLEDVADLKADLQRALTASSAAA